MWSDDVWRVKWVDVMAKNQNFLSVTITPRADSIKMPVAYAVLAHQSIVLGHNGWRSYTWSIVVVLLLPFMVGTQAMLVRIALFYFCGAVCASIFLCAMMFGYDYILPKNDPWRDEPYSIFGEASAQVNPKAIEAGLAPSDVFYLYACGFQFFVILIGERFVFFFPSLAQASKFFQVGVSSYWGSWSVVFCGGSFLSYFTPINLNESSLWEVDEELPVLALL